MNGEDRKFLGWVRGCFCFDCFYKNLEDLLKTKMYRIKYYVGAFGNPRSSKKKCF